MKLIQIRPGTVVAVSDAVLARARGGLQAFGVSSADLNQLSQIKVDATMGATVPKKCGMKADKPWVVRGHAKS